MGAPRSQPSTADPVTICRLRHDPARWALRSAVAELFLIFFMPVLCVCVWSGSWADTSRGFCHVHSPTVERTMLTLELHNYYLTGCVSYILKNAELEKNLTALF